MKKSMLFLLVAKKVYLVSLLKVQFGGSWQNVQLIVQAEGYRIVLGVTSTFERLGIFAFGQLQITRSGKETMFDWMNSLSSCTFNRAFCIISSKCKTVT